MSLEPAEFEPTRRHWIAFWCMIVQQAQNAFNDLMAQFTLIPLGAAVSFCVLIPIGSGINLDVPSLACLIITLPMILLAPVAGWTSDRFSKRDVMLCASIAQTLVLAGICGAILLKSMPLALCGFFALAVQSAFFSPAKIGINKELVGSHHLGLAAGIQQMVAMSAILAGQIFAGWFFDHQYSSYGGGKDMAWKAALIPLVILTLVSIPSLAVAMGIPRVPAQSKLRFTPKLMTSHFSNLSDLWKDLPLRRASLGVAFFWGFAAFSNLWSIKLAEHLTGGGKGFGTLSSVFMAAVSLGMVAGFGCASYLLRNKIELGWVPLAGMTMSLTALSLAFMTPDSWLFLITLGFLAFAGAIFLAPLIAWMQDRYPAEQRGEMQSAVNLQDCIAGIMAVILIQAIEYTTHAFHLPESINFRVQIAVIGLACGAASFYVLRLLPGDFLRLIGGFITRAIYRIQVVDAKRVPLKGGVLLLPNHVTFADAFFLSAACSRPVRFVMDESFMANPVIRFFVNIFDTVTIRQDQPREAIRITIDALKQGDLVCLFPEGQLTRTGTLNELRRGFELIARKANHPLIPMSTVGAWGSITSFERGRFFSKIPYFPPTGITIAFGPEITSEKIDLQEVRHHLQAASATAIAHRFRRRIWGKRLPEGSAEHFQALSSSERRQFWVNGYQIGQISALQRHNPFFSLNHDSRPQKLFGVISTFSEHFKAPWNESDFVDVSSPATWVGGDVLRETLQQCSLEAEQIFFDFGSQALEPLIREHVKHYPCLAIDDRVISMSMPDPDKPSPASEKQAGSKPGTWGKLLPGWYLLPSKTDGFLRAHGPAAPSEGLELPAGCYLDAEGFLCSSEPVTVTK